MAKAINILIVEDEPAIAELLAVNLRRLGHCPLLAANAEKAQALIRDVLPDVVLIDWRLPSMSGLALTRELRQGARTRDIPLILLLACSEELGTLAGLDTGADDYITKPFSPRELLSRLHTVLSRRSPQLTGKSVRAGGLALVPASRRVTFGKGGAEREIRLRPVEFKLLHYMMTHPNRVHSRSALLGKVWGDHLFIEERTVDVHIKRLREALAPVRCSRLVETVRGFGYRFNLRSLPVDQ
ncbi:phosphate regulon transcriptional regulatory protein PhoB [mine drainage metagenome]|uniref:Phosphate regulon transcriptional regulatory protein PhoB n=1 Tax=mine drainage metagenome TaxID=410659 RepID=A0A1J5RK54_9ZZZZ